MPEATTRPSRRWIHIAVGIAIGAGIGAIIGYNNSCVDGTCMLTATWWRGAIYGSVMGFFITFAGSSMK